MVSLYLWFNKGSIEIFEDIHRDVTETLVNRFRQASHFYMTGRRDRVPDGGGDSVQQRGSREARGAAGLAYGEGVARRGQGLEMCPNE